MAHRRTREESRADNDERLLRAGRKVFLARGFHGASLDQVSAAAGLTKGAVYARFDGKADLFLALLERHVDERLAEMQEAARGASTPAAAAAAVASQWMERTAAHEGWALLALEFRIFAAREPEVLARYRAIHTRLRDGVRALVMDVHQRAGEPLDIDPERWARLALAIGTGLLLERWADPEEDYSERMKELCLALSRGQVVQRSEP